MRLVFQIPSTCVLLFLFTNVNFENNFVKKIVLKYAYNEPFRYNDFSNNNIVLNILQFQHDLVLVI